MTGRDSGHRAHLRGVIATLSVIAALLPLMPVRPFGGAAQAAPVTPAVTICGADAAQEYVNGLADSLGVMRPTVRYQPDTDRRAVYRVSASRILVPQVEVVPCVTDSIMAHEFGHYVVDIAAGYDPVAFLEISEPFAGFENWLGARDARGVERAAHCIGYRFVPGGVYTRCPFEGALRVADELVEAAFANRLPLPVIVDPNRSGWCAHATCGSDGWAVRWELPAGDTIETLVLQRNGEEIARFGRSDPMMFIDRAAGVRGGDVYTLVSSNPIGSSGITTPAITASPFASPPVPPVPRAVAVAPTAVSLEWDAPPNAGSSVRRWRVVHNGFVVGDASSPQFVVDGLVPGTEHRFRVAACSVVWCSVRSAELVATTPR